MEYVSTSGPSSKWEDAAFAMLQCEFDSRRIH